MLSLEIRCRCFEYQMESYIKKLRNKNNKKEESFCKKFSWFLLISSLSLILACRSWLQIRVSGLGHDNFLVGIECEILVKTLLIFFSWLSCFFCWWIFNHIELLLNWFYVQQIKRLSICLFYLVSHSEFGGGISGRGGRWTGRWRGV